MNNIATYLTRGASLNRWEGVGRQIKFFSEGSTEPDTTPSVSLMDSTDLTYPLGMNEAQSRLVADAMPLRHSGAGTTPAGSSGGSTKPHKEKATGNAAEKVNPRLLPLEQRAQVNYDAYISSRRWTPNRTADLPELSGRFSIGPDGTLYRLRLRALCGRFDR